MGVIKHIKASNLLSFGFPGLDLELQNLNVLIGPNGSGKSNFLEVFEILRALPRTEEDSNNLLAIIAKGGGADEWLCKNYNIMGKKIAWPMIEFEIKIENTFPSRSDEIITHKFSIDLGIYPRTGEVYDETIDGFLKENTQIYYEKKAVNRDYLILNEEVGDLMKLLSKEFKLSVLSQRYYNHGIRNLVKTYESIRLYREWAFGRNTIFRIPQRADQRNDRLESDFSNLGMVLSRLRKDPATKRALIAGLQELYEGLTDFEVVIEGGAVQIFFTEGDYSIPATRLSDGSLRYLCLLAILLDPTPPPLICIEEPELGLHPDIMPKIADLMIDASQRTQLVVTTHSDVLIDALSEQPESVLVCEKHEGQTQIKRLDREKLAHWLKDYRLGQLWMSGEIGGKRW